MAESKHIGLILVAIVALVAVVGLVLLFTQGQFRTIEAVTTPEGESSALVGQAGKGAFAKLECKTFSDDKFFSLDNSGELFCREKGFHACTYVTSISRISPKDGSIGSLFALPLDCNEKGLGLGVFNEDNLENSLDAAAHEFIPSTKNYFSDLGPAEETEDGTVKKIINYPYTVHNDKFIINCCRLK